MGKKSGRWRQRGRCAQERTRVMGDEESETGVVDIERQPEQGRGVKRGGVSCEERYVWRGKVNE